MDHRASFASVLITLALGCTSESSDVSAAGAGDASTLAEPGETMASAQSETAPLDASAGSELEETAAGGSQTGEADASAGSSESPPRGGAGPTDDGPSHDSGGIGTSDGGAGTRPEQPGTGPDGGGPSDASAQLDFLPYAKSGSRLTAMAYELGGLRQFFAFLDTELDFDCTFLPSEGTGPYRCVPTRGTDVAYLDANCLQPVSTGYSAEYEDGLWLSSDLEGNSGTEWLAEGNWPPRRAYRLGEVVFEGDTAATERPELYVRRAGQCVASDLSAGESPLTLRALDPVEESELAPADPTTILLEGNVKLQRLLGEDGSEINDVMLGADERPCALVAGGYCVPGPTPFPTGRFSDSSCSSALFALDEVVDEGRALYVATKAGVHSVARVTEAFERAPDGAGECTAVDLEEGDWFALGEPVNGMDVPVWERDVEEAGDLRQSWYLGYAQQTGRPIRLRPMDSPWRFHLASGELACELYWQPDGSPMCPPDQPYGPVLEVPFD